MQSQQGNGTLGKRLGGPRKWSRGRECIPLRTRPVPWRYLAMGVAGETARRGKSVAAIGGTAACQPGTENFQVSEISLRGQ